MHAALPSTNGTHDETVPVLDASTGGTVKMDALGPIVGTSVAVLLFTFWFLVLESRPTDDERTTRCDAMRARSE